MNRRDVPSASGQQPATEDTRIAMLYPGEASAMSGGPRSVLNLACGLRQRGLAPLLVLSSEGALASSARAAGVAVEVCPLPDGFERKLWQRLRSPGAAIEAGAAWVQYSGRLVRSLRANRVKLLWTRGSKGILIAGPAARLMGMPLVWDIGLEPPSVGLMRWLHRLGLGLSSLVITQGPSQPREIFGQDLANRFREKLVPLIPSVAPARAQLIESARRTRPPEDRRVVLLCVGSIQERKNQGLLLDAMAPLLAQHEHCEVWFAGGAIDESYARRLEERARQLPQGERVRWLGWRDDVPALLADADVLVLTSQAEGVPHVIREAMLASLPVVATDAGAVRDVVGHGETGLVVPRGDTMALRQALARLIEASDERARLGRAARARALAYSHEAWCDAYAAKLQELAHPAPKEPPHGV